MGPWAALSRALDFNPGEVTQVGSAWCRDRTRGLGQADLPSRPGRGTSSEMLFFHL